MASTSFGQSTSESTSTPVLMNTPQSDLMMQIAQYARDLAPQVYQWGIDQYNRNQGNIDGVMRDALSYASPQRIAVDMGMAEAGVQQAGEQGRQSAIQDLQSYGIDPSSGRYAALDEANRVMTAAAAAGAGNQQRMADQAAGNAMRQQAISASLQNNQIGYNAANAMNALLGTAMQMKLPPVGQQSQSKSQSTQGSVSSSPSGGDKGGGDGGNKGGGGQPQQGKGGAPKQAKPPAPKPAGPKAPQQQNAPNAQPQPGGDIPLPEPDPRGNVPPYDPNNPDTWQDPTNMPGFQLPANQGWPATPDTAPQAPQFDTTGFTPMSPGSAFPNDAAPAPGPGVSGGVPPGYDIPGANPNDPSTWGGNVQDTGTQAENGAPYQVVGDNAAAPTGYDSNQVLADARTQSALDNLNQTFGEWRPDDQTSDANSPNFGQTPISQVDATTTGTDTAPTTDVNVQDFNTPNIDFGDTTGGQTIDFGTTNPNDEGWGGQDAPNFEFDPYGSDPYGDPYGNTGYDFGSDPYGDTTDWGADPYGDTGDNIDWGGDPYGDTGGDTGYDNIDWGDSGWDDGSTNDDQTDWGDDPYGDDGGDSWGDDGGDGGGDSGGDDGGDDGGDSGGDGGGDSGGDSGGGEEMAAGGPVMRRPQTGYRPRPMRPARPPPRPRMPTTGPMMPPQQPPLFFNPRQPAGNGPPMMARGGQVKPPTTGGFVSHELSPSGGQKVDDVQAQLNAGEFVIPKDVAAWKGKEFFYKLIAQARKIQAAGGSPQQMQIQTGYQQ